MLELHLYRRTVFILYAEQILYQACIQQNVTGKSIMNYYDERLGLGYESKKPKIAI